MLPVMRPRRAPGAGHAGRGHSLLGDRRLSGESHDHDPALVPACGEPLSGVSRRGFLQAALGVAGTCGLLAGGAAGRQPSQPEDLLYLAPGTAKSRVASVRSRRALTSGGKLERQLVVEQLERTVSGALGVETTYDAWRKLLSPDDIIGLKFNRSGQSGLDTTRVVGEVLISSILAGGWSPRQIVCIEAPPGLEEQFDTTPAVQGFEPDETDFGSGADQLALALRQVTALINVPFLKTHNLAGMTCCLKNLSHGLVRHPARFHANSCTPYIADIVGHESVRSRVRLHLVDALRVVFEGGPVVSAEHVSEEGLMFASTDGVAADAVGLARLNAIREAHGLEAIGGGEDGLPAYLADAQRKGLGVALPRGIDLVELRAD